MNVREPLSGLAALQRGVGASRARFDPLADGDRPDDAFERNWHARFKARVLVVIGVLVCWSAVIEGRLIDLQIVQHQELLDRATNQQQHLIGLPAKRGDIVDRNGELLAYSVDADTIYATPKDMTAPSETAAAICAALDACSPADEQQLADRFAKKSGFVYVKRLASPDEAARVRALKLPGVALMSESRRYYPNSELAAHVLGYVNNADNKGLGGVEAAFDSTIRGSAGEALVDTDASRRRVDSRVEIPPTAGATLELTIDQYLQHIAERELEAGIEEHHAEGGSAIIMDPHTGEILALANWPTFNPNIYQRFPDIDRLNRAIQTIYEPGSTFKIVTASAALQEGVMTPEDLVDTSPGVLRIPNRAKPIRDAEGENHGTITFEDVIVLSSNVGAVKTGLRVGAERMSAYARRFGFGQALSPDFRGESAGIVFPVPQLNESALASMSMGYQVGVTPLQMALAVSAVANGGTLYEPHVVRAIIRDDTRTAVAPKALRQAITPETAATLTSIMEDVTLRGTGKKAQLDNYQVAGKTGTAEKNVDGRYVDTDYNASFVGFVPSRQPRFTIVVVVDTPRGGSYFGGDVAAPIFRKIAEAALRQYAVPPTLHPTPPVIVAASASLTAPLRPPRVLPMLTSLAGQAVVPDVRGLGVREALRVLGAAGLSMRVEGMGDVVSQTPEPGEPLERGTWGLLQLGRAAADQHATGGGGR